VGDVRRRHQRRGGNALILIFRRAGSFPRHPTKYRPPRRRRGGLFVAGRGRKVFNVFPRAAKRSNQKKDDTSILILGRSKCPLSTCDWEPLRRPSHCSPRPAAAHWHKRNTTPAPAIPKSRSATSCRTAGRPPPTE